MRILLVENDEVVIQVLTKSLEGQHYVVDAVRDGEAGWRYGSTFNYDLIVLEVMLPQLDGICLCQKLRAEGCTTPILFLAAQNTSAAKVKGLDAGADDYLVKPFDLAELSARIRALLRRGSVNASPNLTWENLLLNPSTCEVTYNSRPLTLTAKEYELLELFLRDSQHVFSVDEILDSLWSSEEFPAEATVRSHIRRLRHKLTAAGAPDLIATVHGRGYYLRSSSTPANVASQEVAEIASSHCHSEQLDWNERSRSGYSALLLIVDDDPDFIQPLIEQAASRGIRTAIAPTATAARAWLLPAAHVNSSYIDLILLRFSDRMPATADFSDRQALVETLVQHSTPLIVMSSHRANLPALQMPRSAQQRWLEFPTSLEHLLTVIDELLP